MAVKLFSLRGVPEDEADEVRALLEAKQIDFYETPAGSWGMSMPALWLKDEEQLARARQILNNYQQQRQIQARAEFEALKRQGKQRRVIDLFRERPLVFLFYLLLALVVAYLSISPFLNLG